MSEPAVLCVTLNPCLDKTLTVPAWKPGDNVRGLAIREVVGGKGNNVARALKGLGHHAQPVTFLGKIVGGYCESLLRNDDGFSPIIVSTQAETRTILTVRTNNTAQQTAFFDPDPNISPAEAADLLNLIEAKLARGQVRALTLSGSSPAQSTHGFYRDCIHLARRNNVPVLLDTYGPALKSLGDAVPDFLQLNSREVAGFLGVSLERLDEATIQSWLQQWVGRGCQLAVVTQGPAQVIAASTSGVWSMTPPAIEPVNPIGSGDSFLAGLCHAFLNNLNDADKIRFAMACAVANCMVWDAGAINIANVNPWLEQIQIHAG